ncbi:MAG: hypothetical protein ABIQ40_08905 [Bacteroidia bacterium]
MKTLMMFVLALTFGAGCANAQKLKETEVPAAVKAAMAKQYPAIKDVEWEKEGANYEAGFDLNKVETSVVITPAGVILETESEIAVSALPKAATDYLVKNLPGKKIKEAAKLTDANGTVTFEAEVNDADYIFDSNGNFIKKVVEAADKD